MKKTIPLVKRNAATERMKRPDHPDFWTTEECKKNKLTGIRNNPNLSQWEFWILGNLEKTVSFLAVSIDPNALTKAHVELFKLNPPDGMFPR
jgi:hypothetical protein